MKDYKKLYRENRKESALWYALFAAFCFAMGVWAELSNKASHADVIANFACAAVCAATSVRAYAAMKSIDADK